MYSTCLFCSHGLGVNEVVESFPVGRRLAFDPEKGRLWVVCPRCERWNLSPLEERWEAIEEGERIFRETRLRASTENVGLAKLREGLELIRVGRPNRPEFAVWRYGDQFGRRRRRAILQAGVGLGALGAVVVGGMAAGVSVATFGYWGSQLVQRVVKGNPNAVVARIPRTGDAPLEVKRRHLERIRLTPMGSGEWRVEMRLRKVRHEFAGEAGVRAAAAVLPPLNRFGGSRSQVSQAVGFLERAGDVPSVFREAARLRGGDAAQMEKMPYPVRLALEMAAHEEAERRALEGELKALERAWREAEEIAEIADDLLVPSSVQEWIRRVRGG